VPIPASEKRTLFLTLSLFYILSLFLSLSLSLSHSLSFSLIVSSKPGNPMGKHRKYIWGGLAEIIGHPKNCSHRC